MTGFYKLSNLLITTNNVSLLDEYGETCNSFGQEGVLLILWVLRVQENVGNIANR